MVAGQRSEREEKKKKMAPMKTRNKWEQLKKEGDGDGQEGEKKEMVPGKERKEGKERKGRVGEELPRSFLKSKEG